MFLIFCFISLLFAFSKGSRDFESRIVGGQEVEIKYHPYQVSLRTEKNKHFCGGAIINPSWILTAAHCTLGSPDNSVHVWYGTTYLDKEGSKILSKKIYIHPSYIQATLQNDISLIQTASAIPIDHKKTSIIPIASHFTNPGAELVVTGWGYLKKDTVPSNILQRLTTRAISNDECRRYIPPDNVPASKLCTFVRTGQGICQGDSGGPLNENGWLVGVVSGNIPCAVGRPDGFERVAHFRGWITLISGVN